MSGGTRKSIPDRLNAARALPPMVSRLIIGNSGKVLRSISESIYDAKETLEVFPFGMKDINGMIHGMSGLS